MAQDAKRPARQQHRSNEKYTAFDRALISAQQSGSVVRLTLADDEAIDCTVKSVDRYFIEVSLPSSGLEWFNKGFIKRCKVMK